MTRIAVVGTGYVGLTTGACFAHMGHHVSCIDIDAAKIANLSQGILPIYEPGLSDLVHQSKLEGRLNFTTRYDEGLADAEFVVIAVGTPPLDDRGTVDLTAVYAAARSVAEHLPSRAVIITKSTSPIGTAARITDLFDELRPELSPWVVVSNPEFLREGSAVEDCLHPARVVLGAAGTDSARLVADLYAQVGCPVIITDLNSAEMIKYASNAFLATRISFINEVSRICAALGADVQTVARGMGLDPRIGPHFLNAGIGYGGSCFPKDVAALKFMAGEAGLHPQLLNAVTEINEDQRRWVIDELASTLGGLNGRTVAVWGVAFKAQTDDVRQSPALAIISELRARGAAVRAFDPVARPEELEAVLTTSALDACQGADALLIATEWDEFAAMDWCQVAVTMKGDFIFDGRNCVDPAAVTEAGLCYRGIGRGLPTPAAASLASA